VEGRAARAVDGAAVALDVDDHASRGGPPIEHSRRGELALRGERALADLHREVAVDSLHVPGELLHAEALADEVTVAPGGALARCRVRLLERLECVVVAVGGVALCEVARAVRAAEG